MATWSQAARSGYCAPMRWLAATVTVMLLAASCGGGGGGTDGTISSTTAQVSASTSSTAPPATTHGGAASAEVPTATGQDAESEAVPTTTDLPPTTTSASEDPKKDDQPADSGRFVDMEQVKTELFAAFNGDMDRAREAWGDREEITRAELDDLLASIAGKDTGGKSPPPDAEIVDDKSPTTKPVEPASVPRASLASGITAFQEMFLRPEEQINDRDAVPLADLISISTPDGSGMITVVGAPGAVPFGQPHRPWGSVAVIAVEWGNQDCVTRNSDGSFDARLEAPSGSTIYVLPIGRQHCVGQGIQTGPAAVMQVPGAVTAPGAFVALGRVGNEEPTRWSASGILTGPTRSVEFTLDSNSGDCLVPRIDLYRLFDGEGLYVTQVNVNVHGPALTPTGLPIETDANEGAYDFLDFPDATGCLSSGQVLTPTDPPTSLESGWYLPRIMFGERGEDGQHPVDHTPPTGGVDFEGNTGYGYLPMFPVGTDVTPRLPATLFNEAPSWGSAGIRGVVSAEDAGRFALGSRRSAEAPFVASPTDPLSGQNVHYTLEPFLPTVGYTGFAAPLPEPLFSLDAEMPGTVSIDLTTPDGKTTNLATDAAVEMFVAAAWYGGYPVMLPFSGPSHTIGLTTGLNSLDLDFEQFGRHTVRLDGALRSSNGDDFILEGNYEFWVAEPLDLSLGTFEGTPLEVGDGWNPVVTVEPGVPADITIEINHYVDGDQDKRQSHFVSGTANQFGYFASDQIWSPTEHGEYIVKVTATYMDPVDGTLWMGTRTSASIVATPDTPVITHAERNSDLARGADDMTLRTWFFNRTIDPACGEAACDEIVAPGARGIGYPFFSGDVVWVADMTPLTPAVTIDAPSDLLADMAPQLQPTNYCFEHDCVEADDTIRLYSETTDGSRLHLRPDSVDSWAYWYSTSIRPDISVFSAVGEGRGGIHNTWYGHDSYSCQIGLTCRDFYFRPGDGGRGGTDTKGDEEGDVKLLFGGAVLKTGDQQHFAPYASMAVIVKEAERSDSGGFTLRDEKGNRICPPYQGAAGGLGTCGPLLTHRGREVDLFITPMGTRPGSVLERGDRFVYSGQAWPTLDIAVEVTVTSPSGVSQVFQNRANVVGYVDPAGMSFVVDEPGVYEVHVSATQDRALPSTGLAPDSTFVADGRTTMDVYGYENPLSAVLGSNDSTYRFYVVDSQATGQIRSRTSLAEGSEGSYVEGITFDYELPDGVSEAHYSLTTPGLLVHQETVTGDSVGVALGQQYLYDLGFTEIILGADTLQLSIAYETADGWEAQILNQRGFSPLGGG